MTTRATSELVYKLIDEFSAPAKPLVKSASEVEQKLSNIAKFKAASKTLDQTALSFRKAKTEAKQIALEMAKVEKPTSAMQRAMKRAEAEVKSLGNAFAKQGRDVRTMRAALAAADTPVNKLAASERRLRSELERTNVAIARQHDLAKRQAAGVLRSQARRDEWGRVGSVIGYAAAHRAKRFVHNVLETYREFDKERRYGKAVMGLTDEQQAPLVNQALHGGATSRFNDIQWLEGQRDLANRGLKMQQILGVMPAGANLGTAMDLTLPESVKQMENAIFGFQRDISTTGKAIAVATRTADLQVKASKISGMTPDDIAAVYRFGANSAQMSGMSEETLLGFGGILKKGGIDGAMSGVAFRSMMAAMISPTRKAREAMLANGLDFKNYQKNPDSLALDPFVQNVARQYGVKLDKKTRDGLGNIFNNKKLISDPSRFTPAVVEFLRGSLSGSDAKSLKSISGMAGRYRDASMQGVDTNKLMLDLMQKMAGNPALANAIFGSKQGGRIATALGNPEIFTKMMDELLNHSEGYAKQIADERNQGLAGQTAIFEGAMKTLMTQIGKSFDNDGKGGLLTDIVSASAKAALGLAELDSRVLAVATVLGGAGAAFLGFKSIASLTKLLTGGGAGAAALTGSAGALNGSAAALTRAALALGAKGGIPGGIGTGATVGAGAAGTAAGVVGGTGALPAAAVGAGYMTAMGAATYAATSLLNSHDEKTGRTKDPNYRPWTMGRALNLMAGGDDVSYDPNGPLARMNDNAARMEAEKTSEQRAAEQAQAAERESRRRSENLAKIERIKADLAAKKARVGAGTLNPKVYADYEKGMNAQLRNLYASTPEEQGPPMPSGVGPDQKSNGVPLPPVRPPDLSGAAQESFGSFQAAMEQQLAIIDQKIQSSVQRWAGMLSFTATPVISANISTSGGSLAASPARRGEIGLDRSRQTSLRDSKSY